MALFKELTDHEKKVYEYALRDEFKGMGIELAQQDHYVNQVINASEACLIYLRKNGAIAVSREVLQPDNRFTK
ncbi:hypothetical protein [Kurthia sibirica]|uniref:Uncharacterized protein n=1 Tax=Kurthia sibirica TaxID=202750 RepID=A0A2U3AN99_9BACL|nr:hypothetical protein [Kurthia sibirica]PWI26008.1 hypothetical protein DEX24_05610 [Kurthia sibirica]GEK35273.1 hypothetical protein KSI01_28060 [Kurthia sibirica]